MKVIALRDARARLTAVLDEANTDRVLITVHGRPAALVIGVRGQDIEDVMLASNPKFWEMIEASRRSDRTLTAEEVRTRISRRQRSEAPSRGRLRKRRRGAVEPQVAECRGRLDDKPVASLDATVSKRRPRRSRRSSR